MPEEGDLIALAPGTADAPQVDRVANDSARPSTTTPGNRSISSWKCMMMVSQVYIFIAGLLSQSSLEQRARGLILFEG